MSPLVKAAARSAAALGFGAIWTIFGSSLVE
jgi:hypothetical protein